MLTYLISRPSPVVIAQLHEQRNLLTAPMFRYVDICLGVSFLMSHSLLAYSGVRELRLLLKLFFLLTASTLTTYWVWFAYLKYGMEEHEASKELSDTRWAGDCSTLLSSV